LKKLRHKKNILLFLKIVVISGAYLYLILQLKEKWVYSEKFFNELDLSQLLYFLLPNVFFALINWSIEALKWKILLKKDLFIGIGESLRHVLGGLTMGIFTPARLGEIPGRALFVSKNYKKKAVFLAGFNSILQSFVTLFVGLICLLSFTHRIFLDNINWFYVILFLFVISLLWIFAIKKNSFIRNIYFKYLNVKRNVFLKVFSLSFLRYFIFLIQYYLAYKAVGISLDFWTLSQITGVILFVLYILPVLNAFDYGIRGSVALLIFKPFNIPSLSVLSAVFIIWIINILIPAIIGGIIILMKKKRS